MKTINDNPNPKMNNHYGDIGIWYMKKEWFRDGICGAKTTLDELEQTHTKVGMVEETDPDKIWMGMQGEMWSPNGEARELISSLGLVHTSMSVGDVIVIGDTGYQCAGHGWREFS